MDYIISAIKHINTDMEFLWFLLIIRVNPYDLCSLSLRKALDSIPQPILSSHRHLLHTQCSLDFGVRYYVVLGEFLHALAV